MDKQAEAIRRRAQEILAEAPPLSEETLNAVAEIFKNAKRSRRASDRTTRAS